GADLANADFAGTDLIRTDLRYADLKGAHLDQPGSMDLANFYGVRNLSEALRMKLLAAGAVSIQSDEEWMRAEQAAPPR
ncbi:MAG: pentapeptide repeat-containing protein, partial [Bryobacteraceae bacterium]